MYGEKILNALGSLFVFGLLCTLEEKVLKLVAIATLLSVVVPWLYKRLTPKSKKHDPQKEIEEAQEWMRKGEIRFDHNLLSKAEEKYSRVLERAPRDRILQGKSFLGRGAARYLQSKIKEGETDISHGKNLCPSEGKEMARRWQAKADEERDSTRAVKFYLLALECSDESDEDFRLSTLEELVDVEFQLKAFKDAIEHAKRSTWARQAQSQALAERWQERGQHLIKGDQFALAGLCYKFAIEYAPTQPMETMLKGFQLVALLKANRKKMVVHTNELRDAWEAAASMNNFKDAVFLLEEILTCLQGKTMKGNEFATEVRRCLSKVLFQDGGYNESLEISSKILTISQEEIEEVISRGFKMLNGEREDSPVEPALELALKYFTVALDALRTRSRPHFSGYSEGDLLEEALKGKTLTLLQMDNLEKAFKTAELFVHQNIKRKEPEIHTWLRFCLRTGEYKLFTSKINNVPKSKINERDEFGCTLYHVAAEKGYSDDPYAIQILTENEADPLIKDNQGMLPGCTLDSSDPRKKILQQLVYDHTEMELQNANFKRLRKLVRTAIQEGPIYEGRSEFLHKGGKHSSSAQSKYLCTIPERSNGSCSMPTRTQVTNPTCPPMEHSNLKPSHESSFQAKEQTPDKPLTSPESKSGIKEATETVFSFENPNFPVMCSTEVKDVLHAINSEVPNWTKMQIVKKIRQLAEGRRTKKLATRLHNSKEDGITLYETRVTKAQRILWQEAKGFASGHGKDVQIIRIWKIVFQHDHVDREARNIRKSFRAPLAIAASSQEEKLLPVECSPNGEYHAIKKFYSMTKYMINNVLSGVEGVDYPFEVTELEQEIINLKPSPACSIIVLGRSGTGKTTCCLYRLWNEYHSFQHAVLPSSLPLQSHESAVKHQQEAQTSQVTTTHSRQEAPDNAAQSFQDAIPLSAKFTEKNEVDNCERFHQLFISRNSILCGEIAKMFRCLRNAHFSPTNYPSIPSWRIQDVPEHSWPQFLSVHQWLVLLDASLPGKTFFPRDQDGRLRCTVTGMDCEIRTSLQKTTNVARANDRKAKKSKSQVNNEPVRKMVTYEVFTSTLWPAMTQIGCEIQPSLVWTEIMSFIKGSLDALQSGELSLEEYEKVGKKMAPSFHRNRAKIYDFYLKYKDQKKRFQMFDECDLVYDVYKRLQHAPLSLFQVDRFYVDEAQDLTQAELFLLLHCCRDPNGLFFSGDTAQTIMKGVSFRFEDLKSLFHKESQLRHVNIPKKIHQLTCNYRSHSGIVNLASSVVELLQTYFPKSIDTMDKEQGLFSGPKPVLIESCDFDYLRQLLNGQQRGNSPIELGAHQVVLVSSEEARDSVPAELKEGLVMTVYEAKGLEFDDVLIFNFFKDSEAKEKWRVVANVGTDEKPKAYTKTRPLKFDEGKHKILNSELKHLYTAITRARANVWFYDEDEEARRPMFEFFQNSQLATISDEGVTAKKSTAEEWTERGMTLYKDKRWKAASTAFMNAGDFLLAAKCKAHIKFAKTNASSSATEHLKVAKVCLDCDMTEKAGVALDYAGDVDLRMKLQRKLAARGSTGSSI